MSNVVTENILLIVPVFFTLMIFTLVANNLAINFNNQERLIIIHNAENELIGSMNQLYFKLSDQTIQPCVVTKTNPLPSLIDGQPYTITGSMKGEVMTLTVYLPSINVRDNVTFTLGSEAFWGGGTLNSVSQDSRIIVVKQSQNSMIFSFG